MRYETGRFIRFWLLACILVACPARARAGRSDAPDTLAGRVIVVDPGHGGADGGATRAGVREKDVNLDLALALKAELESRGATVLMTRSADRFVSLEDRVLLSTGPCPDVLISIHTNSTSQAVTNLRGIETYWWTDESLELARKIHAAVITATGASDRGVRRDRLFVVHHAGIPAVLVEVGYLNNAADRRLLVSPAFRKELAEGIAAGIEDYFRAGRTP